VFDSGKFAGERGFSLPETLIAAAIAAGVVAAAAQSIAASVRLSNRISEKRLYLEEAETIIARLRAGMNDKEALEGLDRWSIKREAIPPFRERELSPFDHVTVTLKERPQDAIELWAPSLQEELTP